MTNNFNTTKGGVNMDLRRLFYILKYREIPPVTVIRRLCAVMF